MPDLPAGETLPDYDDQHPEGVDIDALHRWLMERSPNRWGPDAPVIINMSDERAQVRDVLAALQAVGDATLVKNGTYRALRRDAVDIERLAAGLTRLGYVAEIVEHHGSPVDTALTIARLAEGVGETTTTEAR